MKAKNRAPPLRQNDETERERDRELSAASRHPSKWKVAFGRHLFLRQKQQPRRRQCSAPVNAENKSWDCNLHNVSLMATVVVAEEERERRKFYVKVDTWFELNFSSTHNSWCNYISYSNSCRWDGMGWDGNSRWAAVFISGSPPTWWCDDQRILLHSLRIKVVSLLADQDVILKITLMN